MKLRELRDQLNNITDDKVLDQPIYIDTEARRFKVHLVPVTGFTIEQPEGYDGENSLVVMLPSYIDTDD